MIRNRLLTLALSLVSLAFIPFPLEAQIRIAGAVSGTITDPTGAVVPNASVTLKDEGTGIAKQTTANGRNTLNLARLVPGQQTLLNNGDTHYNGLPGGAMNVTTDGINNASNGFKSGGTSFFQTVPARLGAVEEIAVETGGLGAESGAESGVNLKFITKRGTDHYHGTFYWQPTSSQFNAVGSAMPRGLRIQRCTFTISAAALAGR